MDGGLSDGYRGSRGSGRRPGSGGKGGSERVSLHPRHSAKPHHVRAIVRVSSLIGLTNITYNDRKKNKKNSG